MCDLPCTPRSHIAVRHCRSCDHPFAMSIGHTMASANQTEPNRNSSSALSFSRSLTRFVSPCLSPARFVRLSRKERDAADASPLAKKLGLQMWRNVVLLLSSCDGGPSPAPSRGISTPLINPHLILTHSQEVLQTFLRLPDLMTSLILRNSLSLGKTSTA